MKTNGNPALESWKQHEIHSLHVRLQLLEQEYTAAWLYAGRRQGRGTYFDPELVRIRASYDAVKKELHRLEHPEDYDVDRYYVEDAEA